MDETISPEIGIHLKGSDLLEMDEFSDDETIRRIPAVLSLPTIEDDDSERESNVGV